MEKQELIVREFMTTPVITIRSPATLAQAHDLMLKRGIRRLPVVDEADQLIGLITLSDIQRLALLSNQIERNSANQALKIAPVGDIMTTNLATVSPDDTLQTAADRMIVHEVSGLPVIDEGEIVGMITESDIFKVMVENLLLNRFLG